VAKKPPTREDAIKKLTAAHDLSVSDLSFAISYLSYYGYLDDTEINPVSVADAAQKFQEVAKIDADGVLGQQTLETMWLPRCGCRDDALTENARWRRRELRWWVDAYLDGIPGLSRADQDDLQIQSLQDFSNTIDVVWTRARNRSEADLIVATGEGRSDGFDGPGGVLAWCEIPNGTDRPITMKFDRSDSWIKSASTGQRGILYGNVDRHEKGHGHGMLHITGPTALLNPIYSPNVGKLLAPDKDALYALGYARATTPTPPPTQPGTRSRITLTFEGNIPDYTCTTERGIP
jgi:hypothetical protein